MAEPLTKKQRRFLVGLAASIRRLGYAPTFRDMQTSLGFKSPRSVAQFLDQLERKGWIQRDRNKARAIRVCARVPSRGRSGRKGGR